MDKVFNFKKVFLVTMIVSLVIGALVGVFVFLFGDFGNTEIKILVTTVAIGVYSLTGLAASTLYERQKFVSFSLLGIISSVISFLFTFVLVWNGWDMEDLLMKIFFAFVIISFSVAHMSLLLLINPKKLVVNLSLWTTVTFIAVVSLMLIVYVFNDYDLGEMFYRLLGAFAILDVLGTIVTPVLNKVYSSEK